MEITGKVHCFFEQSGTFKRAFLEFGIPAEDYDIQNNFGQTEHQIDIFSEIEKCYSGNSSVFDSITRDDLIFAFFPCIEFSCVSQIWYSLSTAAYHDWPYKKRIDYMIYKNKNRAFLFELLIKFCGVCLDRGIRMIFENPWGMNTYLKQNVFLKKPSIVDCDRSRRGDFRIKPTAYWFFNCEPTHFFTPFQTKRSDIKSHSQLKKAPRAGLCSEERSLISSEYARNFISDFVLGRPSPLVRLQQASFF